MDSVSADHEQAERLAYEEVQTALRLLLKSEKQVYRLAAENGMVKLDALAARLAQAEQARYGILPFLCPVCNRKRVEYEATADGRLFVRCTKCSADHDTLCDAALAATENPDGMHE